jgi:hypothetical protein
MRCFQHGLEVGSKLARCKNNCSRLSDLLCEVTVCFPVLHETQTEVCLSCLRNSPAFTEPETRISIFSSVEPSTGSCRYTLHNLISCYIPSLYHPPNLIFYFFNIHINVILPSTTRTSKLIFPLQDLGQSVCYHCSSLVSVLHTQSTSSSDFVRFLITFGEDKL